MRNRKVLSIAISIAGVVVSSMAAAGGVWQWHTPYYGAPEYGATSSPGFETAETAALAARAAKDVGRGVWHTQTPYYGAPSFGTTTDAGYATAEEARMASQQRLAQTEKRDALPGPR